jgi:hypothetical protein
MTGRLTYAGLAGFHLCANTAIMALSLTYLHEANSFRGNYPLDVPQFANGVLLAASLLLANIGLFAITYRNIARTKIEKSSVINISAIGFFSIIIFDILVLCFTVVFLGAPWAVDIRFILYVIGMFWAAGSSLICWIWWGRLFWLANRAMSLDPFSRPPEIPS